MEYYEAARNSEIMQFSVICLILGDMLSEVSQNKDKHRCS